MRIQLRYLLIALCAMVAVNLYAQESVYQFNVKDNKGQEVALEQYKGKVLLVVNTATNCGFTPQYKELQELYDAYKSKGFEVLDFPCNQFGGQAPGSDADIQEFCTKKYETTFPRFTKVEVNGENALPLYVWLKSQKGFAGFDKEHKMADVLDKRMSKSDPEYAKKTDIKWNFTKFLIDAEGRVVQRFEPTATKTEMQPVIENLLKI